MKPQNSSHQSFYSKEKWENTENCSSSIFEHDEGVEIWIGLMPNIRRFAPNDSSLPTLKERYFQTNGQRLLLQNSFSATVSGKCGMQIESVLVLIFFCASSIQSGKSSLHFYPKKTTLQCRQMEYLRTIVTCHSHHTDFTYPVPLDKLWSRRCLDQQ